MGTFRGFVYWASFRFQVEKGKRDSSRVGAFEGAPQNCTSDSDTSTFYGAEAKFSNILAQHK